ncbi:SRPBCC domain-containing protein [Flavobacterium magnum]|uniref:SRPBCC domain-containing protein n=1 Tax=Flavobacterium magnum TaxID=2162713 RepID=A0A2S0RD55_9FLAO|nr:SRPBCC domain-containing protein [Flavobacterium magnum]AWA29867.1 SRPBCC domain-containing protein [Flavobacterium magnum]
MENDKLSITHTYSASAETVWSALTDVAKMRQWYFPQLEEFRPEKGFQTEFNVQHDGNDFIHIWKVTEAVALHKIAYEWRYGGFPGNSILSFELFPENGRTKLILTHTGLDSFEPSRFPALSKDNFILGWSHFTASLDTFLQAP